MAIKVHFMIGLLALVVYGGRPTISSAAVLTALTQKS
jgi:hypothetical protein